MSDNEEALERMMEEQAIERAVDEAVLLSMVEPIASKQAMPLIRKHTEQMIEELRDHRIDQFMKEMGVFYRDMQNKNRVNAIVARIAALDRSDGGNRMALVKQVEEGIQQAQAEAWSSGRSFKTRFKFN